MGSNETTKQGNKAMCETQNQIVHVFEQANLGKAPFRFVELQTTADRAGINREREANGQMFTTNYATSCDFCGTCIADAYQIESADGKRFKVGCECVKKTGDRGLINLTQRAKAAADTKKRHAREEIKLAAGRELFERPEVQAMLAKMPHPRKWCADKGETMLDNVNWMLRNAGTSGKLKTYAEVAALWILKGGE
jgi:hypothetical protein